MTPQDKKEIRQWVSAIEGVNGVNMIEIWLVKTESPQDEPFVEFCKELKACLPQISIQTDSDTSAPAPVMRINDQIFYQAVPVGLELSPFLSALEGRFTQPKPLSEAMQSELDELEIPVHLKLYIIPQCPYCPAVVRQMISLTQARNLIRLSIIDGTLFPKMAKMDNIQSAPTLLLDDFRWTGNVPLNEVVTAITKRDLTDLNAETLRGIIHDGLAEKVAEMMLKTQKIFPSFLTLLCHEKWPVRLGAMVVMETIIEADRKLAEQMIDPLCEAIHHLDEPVKGDILYILGEIGNSTIIPLIASIAKNTQSEEIRTAAIEAMDAIRFKGKSPIKG